MQTVINEEQLFCVNHPQTETALRCSKCLDPMCLRCAVRTPVGLRCPKCTGAERGRDGTYFVPSLLSQVSPTQYAKAAATALGVGVITGIAWGQWRFAGGYGDWSFWFALVIGLLAGELVARAANERRGPRLQALAAGAVLVAALMALTWSSLVVFDLPLSYLRASISDSSLRYGLGLTIANGIFVLFGMFVAALRLRL